MLKLYSDGTQDGTQDGTHKLLQELIAQNPKITRKAMAEQFSVSIRTLQGILNHIPNIHYVGTGSNGHCPKLWSKSLNITQKCTNAKKMEVVT